MPTDVWSVETRSRLQDNGASLIWYGLPVPVRTVRLAMLSEAPEKRFGGAGFTRESWLEP